MGDHHSACVIRCSCHPGDRGAYNDVWCARRIRGSARGGANLTQVSRKRVFSEVIHHVKLCAS